MENILMGFVFTGVGYVMRIIFADLAFRKLKIKYGILLDLYRKTESDLKISDSCCRKTRNDLLDLRRRYDKIYSNNYSKFK